MGMSKFCLETLSKLESVALNVPSELVKFYSLLFCFILPFLFAFLR